MKLISTTSCQNASKVTRKNELSLNLYINKLTYV